MATPPKKNKKSNGEKPTKWYVVLHLVDGKVKPQREWWREMVIGDEVYFLSPDGDAQVHFTPLAAEDLFGNEVKDRYPFGTDNITIHGSKTKSFRVVHSCKSRMTCSIVKNGVVHTWKGALAPGGPRDEWKEGEYAEGGMNTCTGGGDSPVVCHH